MKATGIILSGVLVSTSGLPINAHAYEFDTGLSDLHGSWVTNLTAGGGIRLKDPSCSLTGDPGAYGCGAAANTAQWGSGDNGDLNYRKGQPFSTYISATSELLMTMPSQGYKFMIRGTALYDFLATDTARTPLSSDAVSQLARDVEILDLWGEKDFHIGGRLAHVRLGNQVINWGESAYASGGINATNAFDVQKILIPGTQLKQALLPAPMISFASGLPAGFSTEAYLQFKWNGNRFPPSGSYWSVANNLGRGAVPATINTNNFNVNGLDAGAIAGPGSNDKNTFAATNNGLVNGLFAGPPTSSIGIPGTNVLPGNKPQFGVKLNYKPAGADLNLGFYYENYIDKSPVLTSLANLTTQWSYLRNRQLFGISANLPVGDWAIGTELSYRPHDAVAMSGCFNPGGPLDVNTNSAAGVDCQQWADKKKFQYDVTALLLLTRSQYPFLNLLGASEAVLTAEVTWIYYPGVSANNGVTRSVNGVPVMQVPVAGYFTWLNNNSGVGYPIVAGQGTASSVGATFDFNWTYDGNVIPGWQMTPGLTFTDSIYGYTPTFSANYMQGAKSINAYVLFNQNPATWQAGVNFTAFFGGHQTVGQPYADRNFVGLFATRNF